MKILEESNPTACTKALKIELQQDEIHSEMDEVYQNFSVQANVPGFRRGKVPRKIIEMRYGKDLYKEAVAKAIDSAYKEALDELDVTPISQPEIKPVRGDGEGEEGEDALSSEALFDRNKPVVFQFTVEYIPEIESVDYKEITVALDSEDVSEKDVNAVLKDLQSQNAAMITIEDRPVSDEDIVTLSSQATLEGGVFQDATHDEVQVEIGSGKYIPGFEEEVRGMAPCETKTFTLTLPDTYPNEAVRGKEVEFTITVKQIQVRKLPELDDDFAKDLGTFETLDELKEQIRKNEKETRTANRKARLLNDIRNYLLEHNSIEIPDSMVKRRFEMLAQMADANLRQQYGTSFQEAANRDLGLIAEYEKQAQEDVKISILLKRIAELEHLEVDEYEYIQYIQQVAQEMRTPPEMLLKRITGSQIEEHFRMEALEGKVMQWLANKTAPDVMEAEPEETEDGDE